MGNIALLDDLTINKIAAGEVIERPASAVKELVENSIDAGATKITVEIKNGGISYIRVTDNGKGIMQDDMEIAFERHATSKIRNASDLENVKSMGFRGEALASIAAIAKVTMNSKTQMSQNGNQIIVVGGKVVAKEEIGCPNGTSVTIENLFFNTPVRYKFLRRDYTEAGYIEDTIARIALIHPEIAIKLINTGKTVIQTSGNNEIRDVIYGIYGKDVAENIINVNYEYEDIRVIGVAGKPEIARSNRANQLFFVNKRYVKDKILSSSVEQAYKNLIPVQKYAFVVLDIEMNPQEVDVNVHPAKLEVRFENEQKIFKAVYHAIKDTLVKHDYTNVTNSNEKDEKEQNLSTLNNFNASNIVDSGKTNITSEKKKSFFDRFSHKKDNNEQEDNTNTIEAVYEARKSNIIPNSSKTDITSSHIEAESKIPEDVSQNFSSIINKMAEMRKSVYNFNASQLEEKENKDKIQDDLTTITQPKMELKDDLKDKSIEQPKNEQKEDIKKEILEGIKQENVEQTSCIEQESTSEMQQENEEVMKEQIDKKIEKLKEKEEELKQKENESFKDFQKMYATVFGVETNEETLNENEEEYKIPNANEIIKTENISIFDNDSEKNIPQYKYIGIAFDSYIILEIEKELYIVNQYLANEKIIFENLKTNYYKKDTTDSQQMLLPDVINLSEKQIGIVKDNMEMFKNAGFTVEEFGPNTVKLSSVPEVCMELDTKEIFLKILEEINKVARTEKQEVEERFLATLAKIIAKESKIATLEKEAKRIIDQLLSIEEPFITKLGEPVCMKMTKYDIERKFSRK